MIGRRGEAEPSFREPRRSEEIVVFQGYKGGEPMPVSSGRPIIMFMF